MRNDFLIFLVVLLELKRENDFMIFFFLFNEEKKK